MGHRGGAPCGVPRAVHREPRDLFVGVVVLVGVVALLVLPGALAAPSVRVATPSPVPAFHGGTSSVLGSPRTPLTRLNGVDVSSYQGGINWNSVASDGIVFAFTKATQGDYYIDSTFAPNEQNGHAAGVYVGGYDFADPVNVGAVTEANYFDSVAGPYFKTGFLYPALDLEQGCGTLSVTALSDWTNTWMRTVQSYISAHGFNIVPIVYMNSNYANNCVDSSVAQWHLWIADYCGGCNPSTGVFPYWNFYQYYDCGSISGIGGCVDVDWFGGDLSALQGGFVFGTPPLTASYSVVDRTTGKSLYCGDSFASGDTIQFTGSASGGSPGYSFAWDFGDGTTGSGNPVNHVYNMVGTVNPILTVTDSKGATAKSGSGCDFTVTGTPVTFYTQPPGAATILLAGNPYTNGQSTILVPGHSYSLTFGASPSYIFSGWNWTGGVTISSPLSTSTTLTVTSTTPATVTVSFVTRSSIYFLSSPNDKASVEIGGSIYNSGQNVTASVGTPYPLLALPNPGYVFVQWQVTGTGIQVQSPDQASTNLTVLSAASSTLTEVVLWNVPKAPTDLNVIGATSSSLTLTWDPPPGDLSGYTLGSSTGASPPSGIGGFQLTSFGGAGSSYVFTGLEPQTKYWLSLAGVNSTGQGGWSAWTWGTTLALPQPPSDLVVDRRGSTWAYLSWLTPTGGASIGSYTLNCSTSTPGASDRIVPEIPTSSTVYNATGLTAGAHYSCFLVSVSGAYTSPPSNDAAFTLTGGAAPPPSNGGGAWWEGVGAWLRGTLRPPFVLGWALVAGAVVAAVGLLLLRKGRHHGDEDDAALAEALARPEPPGTVEPTGSTTKELEETRPGPPAGS
ncbi:MAG: fibronectin type III domain-containing protein [Euryarchaeota archaeon]|nr:fibronectin type III domain-containing protein [Euryarchaeota archaeon]MDE2045240.1 fibronectin type III domain-containing protein [Thermoplasmata archaeon]